MKKQFLITFLILFGLTFLTSTKAQAAVNFKNKTYDVEVNISNDSTFTVSETIVNKAYGNFHALTRSIPLNSSEQNSCYPESPSTCGGFDRIIPIAVYSLDGVKYSEDEYKVYEVEDDDTGQRYLTFEKIFYPEGRVMNGEEVGWKIVYKVLGGIEWIKQEPIFYWNLLPYGRPSTTETSHIEILFPDNVDVDRTNATFYDQYPFEEIKYTNKSIVIDLEEVPAAGSFTMSYTFSPEEILKPAILSYTMYPYIGSSVLLDDVEISTLDRAVLDFIPAGKHIVTFSHPGYESYPQEVEFSPAKVVHIEAKLNPNTSMNLLILIENIFFVFGIVLAPLLLILVILNYRKRGRDKDMPKTIIPLFSPPKGVRPYLLGTIKDENVDRVDISGSIIDLAYRGYIKIQELEKDKNYKLIKRKEFDDESLEETEKLILTTLFGTASEVETQKLGTKFATKYYKLEKRIYKEVVEKGYFDKEPKTVRASYLAFGILMMIFGVISLVLFAAIFSSMFGYIIVSTLSIALMLMGISFAVSSKFMPAKTTLGSKVFAEILGFRMYLYTAERYRLQKLEPSEFEKYLSYAIVFGIEKEWAEKFKDIYKGKPDWFEGTSTDALWNAYWISSFSRSFSDSTALSFSNAISSGGSASGSGWSGGGGGFSGFSGGGGGGGFSGGW